MKMKRMKNVKERKKKTKKKKKKEEEEEEDRLWLRRKASVLLSEGRWFDSLGASIPSGYECEYELL